MGVNLKDIRRKIVSVNNTKKTTRAMKLVSTSKLKKTEELARRAKVYANRLSEVSYEISRRIKNIDLSNVQSKFFAMTKDEKNIKVVDIIFITADKGLCGGFNQATIKEVLRLIKLHKDQGREVRIRGIGKKGISFFTFNRIEMIDKVGGLSSAPSYEESAKFIKQVAKDYSEGKCDKVILVHNGFKNMISQELHSMDILPLAEPLHNGEKDEANAQNEENEIISIESAKDEAEVINELAFKYIEYTMYYALIDSLAAEHCARVQAMDAATNNATELARSLSIQFNKARQEAITTELVEINAGAEAMK